MAVLIGVRSPVRRRSGSLVRRQNREGAMFVLPALLFVVVFFLIPLVMTGWLSLHNWPLFGTPRFTGLQNYQDLVFDQTFLASLGFTIKYTLLVTPLIFLVAFGLALLARQPFAGVGIFRTAFFLPVVIGLNTASLIWVWMFNDQVGIFDGVLQGLHLIHAPIIWLATPNGALIATVVMIVWKTSGLSMLLFLGGMQAIPEEFYESARIDGSGRWAQMRYITLPLMRRTFALALTLSLIGSFLAFDQFFIMIHGGPQQSTLTTVFWIYSNAFTYFKLGYGSAMSIVLLLILVTISALQLYLLRDDTQS